MRRLLAVSAFAVAALLAAAASPERPVKGTLCLDVGGESRPPVCHGSASRLDQGYDICLCKYARAVDAPICARGTRPPVENRAYEKARLAASRDGSLFGDAYEGRPMCVAPRNP
jgi:hypothetical protein